MTDLGLMTNSDLSLDRPYNVYQKKCRLYGTSFIFKIFLFNG